MPPRPLARGFVRALFVAGAVAAATAPAHAQRVRGVALLPDSVTPAPGVIVEALSASGTLVARTLANSRGEFTLALAGLGRYSIRVLRIGYRPTLVDPFDVAINETHTVRTVLTAPPVLLTAVTVRGRDQCRIRPDSAQSVSRVWEEARKAMKEKRGEKKPE